MPATIESVLSMALTLSEQDRTVVAEHLLESVEPPDEDISDEMKSTLDRRWEEIVSGKVVCREAFEVLDEIRARLHERLKTAS